LIAASTTACTGRKRKFLHLDNIENPEDSLNSSLDEKHFENREDRDIEAKKLLTIWTTSFSTKTATVFEQDRSATISMSAACSLNPVPLPGCG